MDQEKAVLEIGKLKARYFRYMDTKKWKELRSLFSDKCQFKGARRNFKGPDEFVEALSSWLEDGISAHHGFMPEYEFINERKIRAIWSMTDRVFFEEPKMSYFGIENAYGFFGAGHYEDEYIFDGKNWLISYWCLTRIFVQPILSKPNCAPIMLSSSIID